MKSTEMARDKPLSRAQAPAHLDNTSPTNDLSSSTDEQEQRSNLQIHNSQQRCSIFEANTNTMSTTNLAESNSCPLTHQYHYIQYPAYYQHMNQQTAMPQAPTTVSTCHCPCSCGSQAQAQQQRALPNGHSQQGSVDSQMAVAVIVHHHSGSGERPIKTQSEQSLLNHSYQALQVHADSSLAEKPLNNVLGNSKLNVSCDCDLECTCGARAAAPLQKNKHCSGAIAEAMLGADEITVSESDNNSTMIKKKKGRESTHKSRKFNSWCTQESTMIRDKNCDPNYDSNIDIYSDGEGTEGADICLKDDNVAASEGDDNRPPLPPRPPPRPRNVTSNLNGHRHGNGIKKYVVWCLICGGFSCLLGILFLGVYFLLHSYTITVGNFETVPTFVPATLLILTGLCIMSLARRRNRYSYLIKLSGACGLISALCCALVTVTTTVLHMSRLQALRECEYAQKTRTCTCYSDMIESQVDRVDKEGVRLVFDSLSDCGVVHGSLYSCLRAIFGLSVAGVLVAVFSCMLVYQLLSHERKKMYWEQLELRCRSLYTSQQGPPPNVAAVAGGRGVVCRCCEQCHAHRQVPLQAAAYPWMDDGGEPRFWTGQPPGNFYSPNPGRDDIHVGNAATCRGHGMRMPNARSRVTGWSWPRMPWQRSSPDPSSRFRQTPSSPDSQYGFSNNVAGGENIITEDSATGPHNVQQFNGLPYGVWGPPPPYSDPNSPARRGYYHHQYIQQTNPCSSNGPQNDRPISAPSNEQQMPCLNHRSAFLDQPNAISPACCVQSSGLRNVSKRQTTVGGNNFQSKGDYENTNTPSDSDGGARDRDRCSNTLPTRKVKKRVEAGAKSIGPNSQPSQRVNVQQVFPNSNCGASDNEAVTNDQEYHEPISSSLSDEANAAVPSGNVRMPCKSVPRHKRGGVENSAFQSNSGGECSAIACKEAQESCDPTESEVYFADVSSCCNMSVKNDNYYEDANQATQAHQHHHQSSNCSHNSNNNEDYLMQRFGQRENSIRSRLPFPQSRIDVYEENINISSTSPTPKTKGAAASSAPASNHMQKEISRQSMCSVESEAKTEFTDLSPSTPCSNKFTQAHFPSTTSSNNSKPSTCSGELGDAATTRPPPNFVASFPYSSESQSLEAHRRSTKNIHELMLTPEAHYEVINDAACQFSMSPNIRVHNPTQQRPTNLIGSKRNELTHKSRERLDAPPVAFQSEMEWSENGGDRQIL